MTLIFSNENRILFNVKETDRLIELNYGNRFTRLFNSKNCYNIAWWRNTLPLQVYLTGQAGDGQEGSVQGVSYLGGKIPCPYKSSICTACPCPCGAKGIRKGPSFNKKKKGGKEYKSSCRVPFAVYRRGKQKHGQVKYTCKYKVFHTQKSEQALFGLVKTAKTDCFVLQTFSKDEIRSLYGLLLGQTVLTQHFLRNLFEDRNFKKAFNPKFTWWRNTYKAKFCKYGFSLPLFVPLLARPLLAFPTEKLRAELVRKDPGKKGTGKERDKKVYSGLQSVALYRFCTQVFATQKDTCFVPRTIKTTVWGFAFGTSFLLLSMTTILQVQDGNRWFLPFLRTQMPGLYQEIQESSWIAFEAITRKYINRDSTPSCLLSSSEIHKRSKEGQEGVRQKVEIFLPFRFAKKHPNRKMQTLIKNVDFYKDQFYIDFSELWNQQHLQNFAAISSKSRCFGKNTSLYSSKTYGATKKWKREKGRLSLFTPFGGFLSVPCRAPTYTYPFCPAGARVSIRQVGARRGKAGTAKKGRRGVFYTQETPFLVQPAHVLNARIPPKKSSGKEIFTSLTPKKVASFAPASPCPSLPLLSPPLLARPLFALTPFAPQGHGLGHGKVYGKGHGKARHGKVYGKETPKGGQQGKGQERNGQGVSYPTLERFLLINCFGLNRTTWQMQKEIGLLKAEQYKKRFALENDSIPSKMATSVVEKKRKNLVNPPNEIVKKLFYEYGVFSIATQALQTPSEESLVAELPDPAPSLAYSNLPCRASTGFAEAKCTPLGVKQVGTKRSTTMTGHERGDAKPTRSFYNLSISLKDAAQLEKPKKLHYLQKEIAKKSNDKRFADPRKEKICTAVNRLYIERISNHVFYKQNGINNRLISGYQTPETKTLQLTSNTSKKRLLGVFKQEMFSCNNSNLFSRFKSSLPSFVSSCSSLLDMNRVCIKVPPALPFYKSRVQDLAWWQNTYKAIFCKYGSFLYLQGYRTYTYPFCPAGARVSIRQKDLYSLPLLARPLFARARAPEGQKGQKVYRKGHGTERYTENVNQTDQTNKKCKPNPFRAPSGQAGNEQGISPPRYLIQYLKEMPYRKISLDSFQEIKPLFEQVNREVRISPYRFRFKKSLFLDYKDYVSWKKDTPAAISISPSLEEDQAIKNSWDENLESEIQGKQKPDSTSLDLVYLDEIKKDLQRDKDGKSSSRIHSLLTRARAPEGQKVHGKGQEGSVYVDQSVFKIEDTINPQTPFEKNTVNETSQETQATTGEEEEKKKEITKLEWLLSVREAEQPVEKRKDLQKLAYSNKKALFSKNLSIEQGKLENLFVKDRKDSFFGITNLFPKRLVAQDQKQINCQILQDVHDRREISFLDLLKLKKNHVAFSLPEGAGGFATKESLGYKIPGPDPSYTYPEGVSIRQEGEQVGARRGKEYKSSICKYKKDPQNTQDRFSSCSLQKNKNSVFVEDILKMGLLNQLHNKTNQTLDRQGKVFLKTQTDLYGSNKSSVSVNATKRSLLKRTAPRNRETQTSFGFASRQHPVYTSNRRLRLRVSEDLLDSQNNNPQSRIDDLHLSQSHRWWQKRRTRTSLLGAPSKRYLVMPEITTQDWRSIIEWQLKTYLLEEEKRLQLLVLERAENKKTDLYRSQENNLLPSPPPCTLSFKGRDTDAKNLFKVKKIAIYLPWTTLKKPVKKPFEWPLTRLSYQSVKDGNQQDNCSVRKRTPFDVSPGTTFVLNSSQKQSVSKKVPTGFVNKKTDFCFVSSISPQFKTSPLSLLNNHFLTEKPVSFLSKGNSQDFSLDHLAEKGDRSLFLIDRGEILINHNQMQNKTFYDNVTKKQLEKSHVYKPFLFEPVTNNSCLLLHQLVLAIAIKDFFKSIYKVFGKVIVNTIKNSSLAIRFLPIFSNATSRSKKCNLFYPLKKRFKDLVGSEDTISSLSEIVWYLRNSCRGRMVPHGVVLVETVSSETSDFLKAIGGEAQVPVIVQSLRALPFTQNHPQRHLEKILTFAQKRRPCILFLDDLDSIGQSRTLLLKNNRSLNNFKSHGENVFDLGTFEKQKWKKPKTNFKQIYLGIHQNPKLNFKAKQDTFLIHPQRGFPFRIPFAPFAPQGHGHGQEGSGQENLLGLTKRSFVPIWPPRDTAYQEERGSFATKKKLQLNVFQNEDFSNSEILTGFATKPNTRLNQTEKIVDQRRTDLMLRLLTVMDGISHLNGVLIVTTSKNPSSLDPALLRPGRFEKRINLQLPNKKRRIELLKIELSKIGHTNPMPWSYFGTRTQDMTGTEIASAINHSAFRAIIQSTVHTATTLEYGIRCVNGENNTSFPFTKGNDVLAPFLARPLLARPLFARAPAGQKVYGKETPFGGQPGKVYGKEEEGDGPSIYLSVPCPFSYTFPYTFCPAGARAKRGRARKGKKGKGKKGMYRWQNTQEMSSEIPFYQAGKAMIHFCLVSQHTFRARPLISGPLLAVPCRARARARAPAGQKGQKGQVRASRYTERKLPKGVKKESIKVNKKTCGKAKICTKKHARKSGDLYNTHWYNLTRTDFSQNTIRLSAGQASKLLYLDSILRLKKKRLLSENKKSLYKKRFRTFFEQPLFLQSDISYKERLKTTLLIDLMVNNFEMYKKRQALYLVSKATGLSPKVLSCFYLYLQVYLTCPCPYGAKGARQKDLYSPFLPFLTKRNFVSDTASKTAARRKTCRVLHTLVSKYPARSLLARARARAPAGQKGQKVYEKGKDVFKQNICCQDLRRYLLFNQTAEPDCFVLFSNKTYKDLWWGGKVVETLKTLKQPLGNWYRLYLPRLEQNKSNREWLFPDRIFNQHISLLDVNRLMHHSFAVTPSLTFLQMPVQMQPLVLDSFLKTNQSGLFTKRSKKRFEDFISLIPQKVKQTSLTNYLGPFRAPTCPCPCGAKGAKGIPQAVQIEDLSGHGISYSRYETRAKRSFVSPGIPFCRKTKDLKPICNSCLGYEIPCLFEQRFYSLQKEKTSRFSYYNMVLSCFYLAFQNCTENRELLDLLADHLIRFKLLRLHEIMRISSFYFY